jgi:hypothetical protein
LRSSFEYVTCLRSVNKKWWLNVECLHFMNSILPMFWIMNRTYVKGWVSTETFLVVVVVVVVVVVLVSCGKIYTAIFSFLSKARLTSGSHSMNNCFKFLIGCPFFRLDKYRKTYSESGLFLLFFFCRNHWVLFLLIINNKRRENSLLY